VFKLNTDGTEYANLHTFPGIFVLDPYRNIYTNSDGASPDAGLVLSGSTLYGTAPSGGSSGNGTVFALNIDGTGFRVLHSFSATYNTNKDGAHPLGRWALSENTLYGTAQSGGSAGAGTAFALNTDGMNFCTLHVYRLFEWLCHDHDGASPAGGLVSSGNTLYGTTVWGGSSGNGTVFSISFSPQLSIILREQAWFYRGQQITLASITADILYNTLLTLVHGSGPRIQRTLSW
jgi:uncharacterized repeat protein (TIGR03803 family)